jgi:hypothetical protein
VKVCRLSSYLERYRYHLCRDSEEVAEERGHRESLLESLCGWKTGSRIGDRYRQRVVWWREMAGDFLGELYSLRQVADTISQRYLDGGQVPFPFVAEEFVRLIGCIEELVVGYNEDFAKESGHETNSALEGLPTVESSNFVDTAALEEAVAPGARQHTAFLVDMARAEALNSMGEHQKAMELVDQHI